MDPINHLVRVSIIICTLDHAEYLQQTLASLAEARVPEAMPTELIVVDNGSTDNTPDVVHQCHFAKIEVHYVSEPKRGQSQARNAGIAAAKGEVILFTDDDLRFPPEWIAGMCGPILTGRADAVAGGVALAPHLRRDWMTQRHQDWVASTASIPQEAQPRMVGANMAFSRQILQNVPRFDTDLGPGALGFADDTLFSQQLLKAGYRLELALDVRVEHHFESSRLSRASFISSAQKTGRSLAYLYYHWEHNTPRLTLRHCVGPVLRLAFWRIKNARLVRETEGISETEMKLVERYWFVRQYREEQRKPRNYSHHGLRKLTPH